MCNSETHSNAVDVLKKGGIFNPLRLFPLIRKQISFFELNLSGCTVLTEAASGPYVVTPIIASLAGAERVIAITHNSRFATVEEVISQTRALESLCEVKTAAEIHSEGSLDLFSEADIVTNLGFVRPLDKETISVMKPTAVIPLMCEAWEIRPGDVDFEACNFNGITVMGTNEDFPGLGVFSYSGFLCARMLSESQIEIHKSNIMVVSSDKFGPVIAGHLSGVGANARHVDSLQNVTPHELSELDALIIADYTREGKIIGEGGDISAEALGSWTGGITVLQFAGKLDVKELVDQGICVYPGIDLGAHRMAQTLSSLGPRPVIELHTAGLKVGELMLKRQGRLPKSQNDPRYEALCMPLA